MCGLGAFACAELKLQVKSLYTCKNNHRDDDGHYRLKPASKTSALA
jgi:hypothetical protein